MLDFIVYVWLVHIFIIYTVSSIKMIDQSAEKKYTIPIGVTVILGSLAMTVYTCYLVAFGG